MKEHPEYPEYPEYPEHPEHLKHSRPERRGHRVKPGTLAERVARRVSRRDALRRVILGGTTGLAALAVGEQPGRCLDLRLRTDQALLALP